MIKGSAAYFCANVANKAAPFLVIPMLTRHLTPEEFGAMTMFLVMLAQLGAAFGLALHTTVPRFYFNKSFNTPVQLIGALLRVLSLSSLVCALLLLPLADWVGQRLGVRALSFALMPVAIFASTCSLSYFALLRCEGRAARYMWIEACQSFASIILCYLFVLVLDLGWLGRVAGFVLPTFVATVMLLKFAFQRGQLAASIDSGAARRMAAAAAPMVPFAVMNTITTYADRYFVAEHAGLKAVGVYSLAYQLSLIVLMFSDAFLKSWTPLIYKWLNSERPASGIAGIRRALVVYVMALLIIALLLPQVIRFVFPMLFDAEFVEVLDYVALLTLGNACLALIQLFYPILLHRRSYLLFVACAFVPAAVNICLNVHYVPSMGVGGAVFATWCSYLCGLVFVAIASRKFINDIVKMKVES